MSAEDVYPIWNGKGEADWMMPHREYIDGLPTDQAVIKQLHHIVDSVYTRGVADGHGDVESVRELRNAIGDFLRGYRAET